MARRWIQKVMDFIDRTDNTEHPLAILAFGAAVAAPFLLIIAQL